MQMQGPQFLDDRYPMFGGKCMLVAGVTGTRPEAASTGAVVLRPSGMLAPRL